MWSDIQLVLPVMIEFEVTFNDDSNNEILPVWSFNRGEDEDGNWDALSWFLGTDRSDFTFRGELFSKGLKIEEDDAPRILAQKGVPYKVYCYITDRDADLKINGVQYAHA